MIQLSVPQILAQRRTRRWHTRPVTRDQSVAEHAHQVALLAIHLAPEDLSEHEQLDVLMLALLHDAHEPEYGDMPHPAKLVMLRHGLDLDAWCRRAFWGGADPYDQVSSRVRALVDAADRVEDALFSREHLPGLSSVIRDQILDRLLEIPLPPESYSRALDALGVRG